MPVVLDNDGNAAALGEFWAGAGRGCRDMVLLTLGTGVGAGVILDGKLLRGHFENAAELGHMIVQAEGEPCPCGQRGCLERYASAAAVARFAEAAGFSPRGGAAKEGRQGIDAEQVALAARQGDPGCARVWDDACRYLAIACINIQHAFNVERVVLGGGMSAAGDSLIDGVRKHLERETWSLHNDAPTILLATLGNDAGVIGAAAMILQSQVASSADVLGSGCR
jgi:glucokinase